MYTNATDTKKQTTTADAAENKSAGASQHYLADNRPQAILQKQQLSALANKPAPIQKKANSTGLPDNLKSGIENLSGHSLDDVKVHYNSSQPAQLNAHAYAQGTDIHVASGQEKHLPHEAWHVVQQKQGRVKPTMQMKGKVNINDDDGLEQEADVMGAKALHVAQLNAFSTLKKNAGTMQDVLQAKKILRNGEVVDVADDYVLQLGEHDFEASDYRHQPRVIFDEGSKVASYDSTGTMSVSKQTEVIHTHETLQGYREQQGKQLAGRMNISADFDSELQQIKSLAENLEKMAGSSVPKNHAAKIAKLAKGKFTGGQYRAVIKAQDELTQSESTTSFFDGLRDGIQTGVSVLPKAKQEQFLEQALRAFSSLRTPTETVNAPIMSGGSITGQQHPTSKGQKKMDGGGSGHSYADRMRVQGQVKAFNNLAKDPQVSAFKLIVGNLLNALVSTLSTMAHPNSAGNVPDFNEGRQMAQLEERERMKKQAAYLAGLLGLSVPSKSVKGNAPLKSWEEPMSPLRSSDMSDDPVQQAENPLVTEAKNFQQQLLTLALIIDTNQQMSPEERAALVGFVNDTFAEDLTTPLGRWNVYNRFLQMQNYYAQHAGGLDRNLTPGGGDALGATGERVPVLEQFMLECGQMAVHNVLSLDAAEQNNDFAGLDGNLADRELLAQHGNFENNIDEDAMRNMLQQAGRAGIPVIGNLWQLNTFINDYNEAELTGQNIFQQEGYGQYLFQDQWQLSDVETQEVMNMNNFLAGHTNSINFIINTSADQQMAAGYHWIAVRVTRALNGQIRLFVLDSIQGQTDYSDMLNLLRQFIQVHAPH